MMREQEKKQKNEDLERTELGKRLKEGREKLGLTQKDMSIKLECSYSSVSRMEKSEKPSLEKFLKYVEILESSPNELLDYKSKESTNEMFQITHALKNVPSKKRKCVIENIVSICKLACLQNE